MTVNSEIPNVSPVHPDSIEMDNKRSIDISTISLEIETNNKHNGVTPNQETEEKPDDSEDDLIVEDGVKYDDTDWQDEHEERQPSKDESDTLVGRMVLSLQNGIAVSWQVISKHTKGQLVNAVLLAAYTAFFAMAMINERLDGEHSKRLLWGTVLFVIIKTRVLWIPKLTETYERFVDKDSDNIIKARRVTRWAFYFGLLILMAYVIVAQTLKDIRNLQPIPGLIVMILVCLLFSTAPSRVNWHTIYWSVGLQFLCSIFVMRLEFGANAMQWIQDRFNEYFANTQMASDFLFGKSYRDHYVIFGAFPTIIFSNATLCVLYYFGAIQFVINCIGSVLQFVMDTTPIESTGVAGGIFLEGVMAFLSLKPYLGRLTKSQLFLLTTSCYSSLGGAFVGMLAQLGVKVSDIIPAMLISAPATFTVCKLIMPEVAPPRKIKVDASVNEERQKNNNVLEVVQNGAVQILSLIAAIVAIIFAVYSFISWINHTLGWFGDRVGVDDLTIELIFSYVLYPVALCMGVELHDCKRVATLLGYRLGSGNIIAFQELTKMNVNRNIFNAYMNATDNMGSYSKYRDDIIIGNKTLFQGFVNERSERMVTYALCGFSSIVSVSLNIGIVITLIPRRRWWLTKVFLVSLIAGNLANCMTGAFAGIFYYN